MPHQQMEELLFEVNERYAALIQCAAQELLWPNQHCSVHKNEPAHSARLNLSFSPGNTVRFSVFTLSGM